MSQAPNVSCGETMKSTLERIAQKKYDFRLSPLIRDAFDKWLLQANSPPPHCFSTPNEFTILVQNDYGIDYDCDHFKKWLKNTHNLEITHVLGKNLLYLTYCG